jgi:hypothetical protein
VGISKPGWGLLLIEASTTHLPSERAGTRLDLGHVLAAAGRVPDARAAATQALDLCQRKGSRPGARDSLRYLARYAPA